MVFSLIGLDAGGCGRKGAIVAEAPLRANRCGALRARERPDQLFHFLGGIDELAAPAVRLAAVGEHQRPAVPDLEVDGDDALRALDAPAPDERARGGDEVARADEQPEAALADVH